MACSTDCRYKNFVIKVSRIKLAVLEAVLAPVMLLIARIYIGNVFWKSGKTKLQSGPEQTQQLFEWEYIPNWEANSTKTILGIDITFPVPGVELAATLGTYAELILPVLLFVGLFGRGAAFMLFGMALTIEMFVYPGTTEHIYWMLLLGILVVSGPGKLSIDYFIRRKILADVPPFLPVFFKVRKADSTTEGHQKKTQEDPASEST